MNKLIKITIITAICLVVAGSVLFLIAAISLGFNFRNANGSAEKTFTVSETFINVNYNSDEYDVWFLPSTDGTVKVQAFEFENNEFKVEVEDGTLKIGRDDQRKWYERMQPFNYDYNISVYLPIGEYGELTAKTLSADVNLSKDLSFTYVSIDTLSGDVSGTVNCKGKVGIETASGDVELFGLDGSALTVNTTSGDIDVDNSVLENMAVRSASGELSLENVTATTFDFHTVSGDIELEKCDAQTVKIETTSGGVDCNFLTGKIYNVKTTSGRTRLPQSDASGGTCDVKTTSGDIEIRIG